MYAPDPSVGSQLPDPQFHIRLILSITCDPDRIIFLQIGSRRKVTVDKYLRYIQNRTNSDTPLYRTQPYAYLPEECRRASHLPDHARCGLQVKYRRQITLPEMAVSEEMGRLLCSCLGRSEEMVGAYREAMRTGRLIVAGIIRIAHGTSLCRLDKDK